MDNDENDKSRPRRELFPERYLVISLLFLATLIMYVERVGFSIAYTDMASRVQLDEKSKGLVMSCFFYGYGITQFPGGLLAQQYGGRRMLLIAFVGWVSAAMLMPSDARATIRMALLRALVGVAQGLIIPAVHSVVALWIPPLERARATSITTSGMYLGSTLAMVLLPSLLVTHSASTIPKLVAVSGIGWSIAWFLLSRDHPFAIMSLPIATTTTPSSTSSSSSSTLNDSWRQRNRQSLALLQSPPILAICLNNFTFHYLIYMIMNWLPTYLSSLLHADMADVTLTTKAWPYFAIFISSIVGGFAGDYLIQLYKFRVVNARKVLNSLGFLIAAYGAMHMANASTVQQGVRWCMVTLGAAGLARGGFSVNHMDIAPRQAAVVMGLSNSAGTVAGVISVALTGFILEGYGGASVREGWVVAMAVAALLCVGGNLVFAQYARGERLFD